MPLVASEVRVAGTGEVFTAAAGTAAPAAFTGSTLTGFTGLGYTADDGVALRKSLTREGISAWQSLTPVRYIYTGVALSVGATYLQSNDKIVKAWMGGGDFAETGAETNIYKSTLPTVPEAQEHALIVRWVDDDLTSILWIPKVEIGDTGDITLNKGSVVGYQINFDAVAPDSGTVQAEWYTNDPAFDPAA